jgi:uncharacterized protein YneF (UPF0154 family)
MTNPVTPAPSGGGMPKWLIILLVVLVVVIIGCCGGIGTCMFLVGRAAKKAADNMPALTQKFAEAAREEAKRQGVEMNLPDANGNAAMPSNYPADIPVYTGAKTVQSTGNLKENAGEVTLNTPDAAADVKTFYQKQMTDQGWKEDATTSNGTDNFGLQYSKDAQSASIQINHDNTQTIVIIIYGKK